MTTLDRSDLKSRALFARLHGYQVARVPEYLAALGAGDPPDGVVPGSVDHLLAALDAAEKGVTSKGKGKPQPKSEPVQAAPEPIQEPIQEPESEEAPAEDHGKKKGKKG